MHLSDDPRLLAAKLTLDEFVGNLEETGDASMPELLVEEWERSQRWTTLPALPLLEPRAGYSLRCRLPVRLHEVYLVYENAVVGGFVATDTMAISSAHRNKGLSRELILAAFAQVPWRSPNRIVSPAGKCALHSAYTFVRFASGKA